LRARRLAVETTSAGDPRSIPAALAR